MSLSTDGGASWVEVQATDLNRPLPVVGSPRRFMLRIANIPRFPSGKEYTCRLSALLAEEPPPLPAGSNVVTFTYEYDACGNRMLTTANGIPETYEYHPQSDRLYRKGDTIFRYDPNGNLILKETPEAVWWYEYDYANRLVAVYRASREGGEVGPEVEVKRYTYDFSGLRLTAASHGVTTEYLYLGNDIIWENRGGEVRNHIWALGKHLARVDGTIGDPASKVYWYHTDHLGTVEVISDAQGQVVWRNEYRAFGEQLGPEVREIENAQAFTGKDWDAEVGLYYFNARWYDPELGRFISEDPLGDPNNPNLYVYCANNPLMRTDPTGCRFDPGAGGGWYPEAIEDEEDESEEGTEEPVPPSPGEAKQQAENLDQLRYLRNLGITSVPYKSTLVEGIETTDKYIIVDGVYFDKEQMKKDFQLLAQLQQSDSSSQRTRVLEKVLSEKYEVFFDKFRDGDKVVVIGIRDWGVGTRCRDTAKIKGEQNTYDDMFVVLGSKGELAVFTRVNFEGTTATGTYGGRRLEPPYPSIADGVYTLNSVYHSGYYALSLNNNGPVPTIGGNPRYPERGYPGYATYVHIHRGGSDWTWSQGCLTIYAPRNDTSRWNRFISYFPVKPVGTEVGTLYSMTF